MKIDPYCQRRNCNPLNTLFSNIEVTLISQGVHPLWGVKQVRGGENKLFFSYMRQYHSPDDADGCYITSNKSLSCLQLVFTSKWSDFRHAFASHVFVSVSWAFLLLSCCATTLCPKKTCDYICYNNFNNRCPITIIFGIVISKSMRHRKMVSFSTSPI